jgi:hypothetical protein
VAFRTTTKKSLIIINLWPRGLLRAEGEKCCVWWWWMKIKKILPDGLPVPSYTRLKYTQNTHTYKNLSMVAIELLVGKEERVTI